MNILYLLDSLGIFIGLLFTYFNLFSLLLLEDNKNKKELKEYPKISIIVPAYNEEKNIEESIKSLLNLDYPKDKLEIIIVDDGSKDNTYQIAKRYESEIVKVYRKENGGKASALNYGIKKASGEFIVTLDADSVVPKDALKKMIRYFDEDTYIVVPSLQVMEDKTIIQKIQSIEYTYDNILRIIFSKLGSIYVAPGPFSIFRKELFEKIGYFDEKNITEDMEIALRAQANGFKIVHCPEVIIKTKAPSTLKQLLRQRLRWYLGYLDNYLKYRKLIKNYLLTELVMGSSIIFIVVPYILVGVFLYLIISQIMYDIDFLNSINYNIGPIINYDLHHMNYLFNLNIFIESYLIGGIFIAIIGILSTILFIMLIKKSWSYEKLYINKRMKDKIINLILYINFYPFIYVTWWALVFYYKIFGRELKWGGVIWNNSIINKIKWS